MGIEKMKFAPFAFSLFVSTVINAAEFNEHRRQTKVLERKAQVLVSADGTCPTMIPPSPLAPDDSSCWQWWDPPADGVVPPGVVPPKGCNYEPCEAAVCDCDNYCCSVAWDLSCRGYHLQPGDAVDNNYFVDGCSAKMLCCEQESAYPDPPVGGAGGSITMNEVSISKTEINISGGGSSGGYDYSYQCSPGSPGCCSTMIPPSFLPPDDSTCWQWWDVPANGVVPPGANPPKGCNYKPCQDAVCQCDPYCCDTAWDLSCRGYHLNPADVVDNNYFVDGCSAKMLCCEPESAYPDPPIGGALPDQSGSISNTNLSIDVNQAYVQYETNTPPSGKGGKKGSYSKKGSFAGATAGGKTGKGDKSTYAQGVYTTTKSSGAGKTGKRQRR